MVTHKGRDDIVHHSHEIDSVADKDRDTVLSRHDGHQKELDDVEKDPNGEE